MLYYLTGPRTIKERAAGKFSVADTVAAELAILENPITTKIISQAETLKMVDEGVMPSHTGDVIFVKHYNRETLLYLRVLRNREFKIVNTFETTAMIRNVEGWTKVLEENGVPVRAPFDNQVFSVQNFDRTRGFGQGFEDFIVEYIKEHNLSQFNLRPRFGHARHTVDNKFEGGYSIENARTFDWSAVDLSLNQYFIINGLPTKTFRVPVVAGKVVREACLATDQHFIDNLINDSNTDVIGQYPEIELYALKAIVALNLEIGYIDFNLIDGKIKVLDIGNYEQRRGVNPFDLTSLTVNYLVQKHES